jgi:hypothetical protein
VIHTLEGAAQLVELTYSRNRNSRPSAMFRKLRRMREWQMFGDYPLLATLFYKVEELGVPVNRGQIRRTIDQSPELKGLSRREKRFLLDALESSEARPKTKTRR